MHFLKEFQVLFVVVSHWTDVPGDGLPSLLQIKPACCHLWHPLQTSQGGWKLNGGFHHCLWPEQICWSVSVSSANTVFMVKVNSAQGHISVLWGLFFLFFWPWAFFSRIHLYFSIMQWIVVACIHKTLLWRAEPQTFLTNTFISSFLFLWPPNLSCTQKKKITLKLWRSPDKEKPNTCTCAHSELSAGQHNKPRAHFTPGLPGIYWVSSHPAGEGGTTPQHS